MSSSSPKFSPLGYLTCVLSGSNLSLSENPHAGLEVFPGQSPVLLNAKKVNLKHQIITSSFKNVLNATLSKYTRGVPQAVTRRKRRVTNTLSSSIVTRMMLIVSSTQFIMLNRIETRFLLFLKTLADPLIPFTLSSCLFLNLKKYTRRGWCLCLRTGKGQW